MERPKYTEPTTDAELAEEIHEKLHSASPEMIERIWRILYPDSWLECTGDREYLREA